MNAIPTPCSFVSSVASCSPAFELGFKSNYELPVPSVVGGLTVRRLVVPGSRSQLPHSGPKHYRFATVSLPFMGGVPINAAAAQQVAPTVKVFGRFLKNLGFSILSLRMKQGWQTHLGAESCRHFSSLIILPSGCSCGLRRPLKNI